MSEALDAPEPEPGPILVPPPPGVAVLGKRYLVFGGTMPLGGWLDFVAAFDDRHEAESEAAEMLKPPGGMAWSHVVDTELRMIVATFNRTDHQRKAN